MRAKTGRSSSQILAESEAVDKFKGAEFRDPRSEPSAIRQRRGSAGWRKSRKGARRERKRTFSRATSSPP